MVNQYDIYWIDLDPTKGSEIQKTRPCVIISPNEMNYNINTIIIAPLTSKSRNYPTRVKVELDGQEGWIILDQIRCIDKSRLVKIIGTLNQDTIIEVKNIIKQMLVD